MTFPVKLYNLAFAKTNIFLLITINHNHHLPYCFSKMYLVNISYPFNNCSQPIEKLLPL